MALEDPARFAATVFSEVLAARGIAVQRRSDTLCSALPAGRRVLATHESAPLAEILMAVNKESQNLHTEMLLRLAGRAARRRGDASSRARGGRGVPEPHRRRARRLGAPGRIRAVPLGPRHRRTGWSRCSWPWTGIRTPPCSARACPLPAWTARWRTRMRGTRRRRPRAGQDGHHPQRERARRLRDRPQRRAPRLLRRGQPSHGADGSDAAAALDALGRAAGGAS